MGEEWFARTRATRGCAARLVDRGLDRADQPVAAQVKFVDESRGISVDCERDWVRERRLLILPVVEGSVTAAVRSLVLPEHCCLAGLTRTVDDHDPQSGRELVKQALSESGHQVRHHVPSEMCGINHRKSVD
jgi:hypothetical protein